MTSAHPPERPRLRVEQALRLLPDVDALDPLRAFLVAASRPGETGILTSERDSTVGKRYFELSELRARVPFAVSRMTEHFVALYEAAVAALEAEQRGDLAESVRALLRAGQREYTAGRTAEARRWYHHALRLAEELRDRRPEIETLRLLGDLESARGRWDHGGRHYQRSLALADAEHDGASAALACQSLGALALTRAEPLGAEAWYTRGLRYAEGQPKLVAELTLGLAEVARFREEPFVARVRLGRVHKTFEALADLRGLARVLICEGQLEAQAGRSAEAVRRFQEALALLARIPDSAMLEMAVRLELSQVYLAAGRLPDVEDEVRRAEEWAIAHNLNRDLARLYLIMGEVRTRQSDENGFVFFEKAIELARDLEPARELEGEAYLGYAVFCRTLGDREAAKAYAEQACTALETVGESRSLVRAHELMQELQHT